MAKLQANKAIVEILRDQGVEYVFGMPGATEYLFMDALEAQTDIKYILGLNENICMGAAEGYARIARKPGFLNLHTGPGLASAMGLLYNAHNGGVPMVITAGDIDSHLFMQEPPLSGPMVSMAKTFTKWSAEPRYAEDIPIALERAFKVAMQPPVGPVFLSIPQDLLFETVEYEHTPNKKVYTQLRPDREGILKAAEIIARAENPAIIVEGGVDKSDALHQVVSLAEKLGAMVYQPWCSDVNFPTQHPLYGGDMRTCIQPAIDVLKKVDVLIVIGCRLFQQDQLPPEPTVSKHTKVIQIDDNPWEVAKNFGVDAGIQADIKVAVTELLELLDQEMTSAAQEAARGRCDTARQKKEAADAAFWQAAEASRNNSPISVTRLMQELRDAIKPDTIVVDDCWSSSGLLRRILDLKDPHSYQRSRNGGAIGGGMPAALGAQLAAPDRPVVAVCGDGSSVWSIQSLWTAAHYRLPITYVITANQVYRQCVVFYTFFMGKGKCDDRHLGMQIEDPVIDFVKLSESFGVKAYTVRQPDDLAKTFNEAFSLGGPSLIEVFTEHKETP